MKKKGAIMEFGRERAGELRRVMRRLLDRPGTLCASQLYALVAASPASRFWVSEERACIVVSLIERGEEPLKGMRPPKRRMFAEIARRVAAARRRRPQAPMVELVAEVIDQPAPEFYMEPNHVRYILTHERARACNY